MSWAEFVLRSIGFREEREFKMLMTREISYESNAIRYAFGKSKQPSKEKFWPIGKKKKIVKEIPTAFKDARAAYLKKVNK